MRCMGSDNSGACKVWSLNAWRCVSATFHKFSMSQWQIELTVFPFLANDKTPIELSSQDGQESIKNSAKGRLRAF